LRKIAEARQAASDSLMSIDGQIAALKKQADILRDSTKMAENARENSIKKLAASMDLLSKKYKGSFPIASFIASAPMGAAQAIRDYLAAHPQEKDSVVVLGKARAIDSLTNVTEQQKAESAENTKRLEVLQATQDSLKKAKESLAKLETNLAGDKARFSAAKDSLDQLLDAIGIKIGANLSDPNRTGISVMPSDVIVYPAVRRARILYRNYKPSLRGLVALDPAEKLGIFRARFIPFAVMGDRSNFPGDKGAHAVFEVGVNFGDATFSGDDFLKPELSLKRLGVAFAISEQLFNGEDLALAATYDLNSYASVGLGANFHDRIDSTGASLGREPGWYFSLGINKKAFEDLLGRLNTLFQ
jgi:hypothetical protein